MTEILEGTTLIIWFLFVAGFIRIFLLIMGAGKVKKGVKGVRSLKRTMKRETLKNGTLIPDVETYKAERAEKISAQDDGDNWLVKQHYQESHGWLEGQRRGERRRFRAIYGYDEEEDKIRFRQRNAAYFQNQHARNCDAEGLKRETARKQFKESVPAMMEGAEPAGGRVANFLRSHGIEVNDVKGVMQ